MPEGAHPYPRWEGPLKTGSLATVIAAEEIRRAINNFWVRLVLMFVFVYAIVFVVGRTQGAGGAHTLKDFVDFTNDMRWGALIVGSVMAGPSLLEDFRKGGIDLYLSRAVTRVDYLVGKVLAVFGLATFALFGPAVVYWVAAGFLFKTHPEHWGQALPGAFVYSIMWGLLVAGLGMGLSAVARSSRAATLILLGSFAILEVFIGALLEPITRNKQLQLISPFSAVGAQTDWLFGHDSGKAFPAEWGLLVWAILVLLGWGLVWWRHPKAKGVEA